MIPVLAVMPTSQVVLRALVLLGPVVALLATAPAGHGPPWWLVVVVAGLSALAAATPDSPALAGVFLVVVVWWTMSLRDDVQAEVMVAAAALVVAHVAALLASYGPATMPVDGATLRLWSLRAGAVLLSVPAVWGVAELVRGEPEPTGIWLLGVAAALAAAVFATVALGDRRDA